MFLKVKLHLFLDQCQVVRRYYKNLPFALADLILAFLYLFSNPYRICRKFLQNKGFSKIHTYGETPLTSLEHIVKTFGISPQDRWLELGSGRGKTSLWLSLYWGCSVRGVDWVPPFIQRASLIAHLFPAARLSFHQQSFYDADFSWPTVVFLYSTCMDDEEISTLLSSMASLPQNAKVITISAPLDHPSYHLVRSTPVSLPWGRSEAYLHIKKS